MPKITNVFEDLVNKYKGGGLTKGADFLLSLERRSKRTAFSYSHGLDYLNKFIALEYPDYENIQGILAPLQQNQIDVYEMLDRFVSYLQNDTINGHDLSALSIKLYLTGVRSYLNYNRIDVIPSKFEHGVKMPRVYREEEQAVDVKDIRNILLNCNNRRLKAYLLVLASGGMRAVEALAIRHKDINDGKGIDLSVSPTKIHIRKEYAKTRIGRDVYISDEATHYLKQWIEFKYRNRKADNVHMKNLVKSDDDIVFANTVSRNPQGIYVKVLLEFQKVLDLAGLNGRKDEGVHHRRKITFHSFRRFVKSTLSNQVGFDYSEWFLGHAMRSPYYTMKAEERGRTYADQCMPFLTFLDYSTLEATGQNIKKELLQKHKQIHTLLDQNVSIQDQVNTMQTQLQSIIEALSGIKDQKSFDSLAKSLVQSGLLKVDNQAEKLR